MFQGGSLYGQARVMSKGRQTSEADPEEAVLQEVQLSPARLDWLRWKKTLGRGGQPLLQEININCIITDLIIIILGFYFTATQY